MQWLCYLHNITLYGEYKQRRTDLLYTFQVILIAFYEIKFERNIFGLVFKFSNFWKLEKYIWKR